MTEPADEVEAHFQGLLAGRDRQIALRDVRIEQLTDALAAARDAFAAKSSGDVVLAGDREMFERCDRVLRTEVTAGDLPD